MPASVLAATALTLVCLGSMVLKLDGMSIGGVMSATCVVIRLASEERTYIDCAAPSVLHAVRNITYIMDWLRYVDGVITMSLSDLLFVPISDSAAPVLRAGAQSLFE